MSKANSNNKTALQHHFNFNSFVASCFALVLTLTVAIGYAADSHADEAPGALGSASCGASTCHGAITPWDGASVLQNEFIVWKNKDKHSQAYKALLSDRAKKIGRNLGIAEPHKSDTCLSCHTFNIDESRHGPRFSPEEGVTCEACHGAAENWLGTHMTGVRSKADRARILAKGMYPTEDPMKRAELCLSCHMGTEKGRRINHQIQGAGHPRLSFELDTFTAVEPAHFVIDADYRGRKDVANGVKIWAIGQAVALKRRAGAIADPTRNSMGVFPEFTHFDCHSCHHPLEKPRYEKVSGDGGPGIPRVNTSNLTMLRIAVSMVDNRLANQLKADSKRLHTASTKGVSAMQSAAQALSGTAQTASEKIANANFDDDDMLRLFGKLADEAQRGTFNSFATAEQAAMAFGVIIAALHDEGSLNGAAYNKADDALGVCFNSVDDPANFNPATFRRAVANLKAAMPSKL